MTRRTASDLNQVVRAAQATDYLTAWATSNCDPDTSARHVCEIEWVGPLVLTPSELARVPSAVPGIYMLHVYAAHAGIYPVIYVGKSRDLRRRLLDHADQHRAKRVITAVRRVCRTYFSAAPVVTPLLLDRIESGLIRSFRPIGNQQFPAAVPVFVNLPPLAI